MDGLHADVARLAFSVLRALLDRGRDGLLVFFVGVVLFGAAAAGYFVTNFVVPASVSSVSRELLRQLDSACKTRFFQLADANASEPSESDAKISNK